MVKNKKGGSGHKRLARKNVKEQFAKRKLRKTYEEGEVYAKVTNVNGGGMFDVMCFNDKKIRLLVVRKKFKGRNKRDNFITLNSILLVGLREWSIVSGNKKEKVDLLYVYTKDQYNELKELNDFDETLLPSEEGDVDIGIDITNEEEYIGEFVFDENKKSNTILSKVEEAVVNWDDI